MNSLNKVKKDIHKLKREIAIGDEYPSLENFQKFCRRYYKRPVSHLGEIIFIEYYRHNADGERISCESNLRLYCQLSVKYFDEIHKGKIGNPVKDEIGRYSLRRWIVHYWQEIVEDDNPVIHRWNESECLKSDEFNEWFESYWDYLINSDDDVQGNFKTTFKGFTGLDAQMG